MLPSQVIRRFLLALLLVVSTVGARQRPARHEPQRVPDPPRDIFTFSEPALIQVRHVDLELDVDFEQRQIRGRARLYLDNRSETNRLILDTRDLTIFEVTADGKATTWTLGPQISNRPLIIDISPATKIVEISYETSAQARGLLWNSAAQSYGRVAPYLYTQNEPDYARSWIPIQDTPGIRLTYSAKVRVPQGLMALMSAENPTTVSPDGEYDFIMRAPIPPYLIALAVGRLEFRALDERTGVYAEPELIGDAEVELQYIPRMLDEAEALVGRYPFERYDVLLMPPTYIVGGMEHPRLNFINPFSVVSGNRPIKAPPSALIAHEMAHSWAGDLATLATWADVWINEGITSYLTLRILEEVAGADIAEHGYFSERRSYESYVTRVDPRFTRMHHEFRPDDDALVGFGPTGYLKGELFIKMLEDSLGRARFDAFLRAYFEAFAFRWVDDQAFLSFLRERGFAGDAGLEAQLKVSEWLYGTGLPTNVTAPTTSAIYQSVLSVAQLFGSGTRASNLPTQNWRTTELNLFLQIARENVITRMSEVDAAFGLSFMPTPPLTWLLISAENNYMPARAALERILMRGGSNSWMINIYDALSRTASGRAFANSIFERARERYEPGVERTIQEILTAAQQKAA